MEESGFVMKICLASAYPDMDGVDSSECEDFRMTTENQRVGREKPSVKMSVDGETEAER
jgi:hypothetical protein